MVTRQTWIDVTAIVCADALQWRPGMVTRQTNGALLANPIGFEASMEAGNGYPAN